MRLFAVIVVGGGGHEPPGGAEAQVHEDHGGRALTHDRCGTPAGVLLGGTAVGVTFAAAVVLCAPELDVASNEGGSAAAGSVGPSSVKEVIFVVTTGRVGEGLRATPLPSARKKDEE